MTRRALLVGLFAPQNLKRLTREPEGDVAELVTGDRAILRGPLVRAATDGSAYFSIGKDLLMVEPDCVLRPVLERLVESRVQLTIERA